MKYEELSLNGFVREMTEASSGFHPRKFCFVLGAGASRTSGIKSGQELVNIWDRELLERNKEKHLKWKKDLGITEENRYSFYSQYYEERFKRHPVDGYNYLEKLMEHAKPSIGYVMLSHLLCQTIHNVVITTNFDHLTEDAVNYYAQAIPLIIGHEALSHYISRQINRPTIIKIHHDLLFDPKNRTDELETLHENWKNVLGIIFSEYHPIFIGYGGNDNSLMDFLVENGEKFRNNEWACPYWMIYRTEEAGGRIREFLEKSNGYLIRHNGFDEVLYLLGANFDYKLPEKEDFLRDAEKRFQALSNAVDGFTKKLSVGKETVEEKSDAEDKSGDRVEETEEINQAMRKITDQTRLQSMYREALNLHDSGEYEEARRIKEELVELTPDNALYHNSLGVTLLKLNRHEEALTAIRKAVELEPDNAEYYGNLGFTLNENNDHDEAIVALKKAIELDPDKAQYHNNCGVALYRAGNYNEALERFQRAAELKPNNAKFHDNIGITLYELKRYEEALAEERKAVELEPDTGRYQENLKRAEKAMR